MLTSRCPFIPFKLNLLYLPFSNNDKKIYTRKNTPIFVQKKFKQNVIVLVFIFIGCVHNTKIMIYEKKSYIMGLYNSQYRYN